MSASQTATISYTEFTQQVEDGNVEAVFSKGESIEGQLKEAATHPDNEDVTYTQFVTERPTFANDDLLSALEGQGTVVSASPLVQERGFLSNLLISFLPMILIIGFWVWLFRRQAKNMGGMMGNSKKVKPVEGEKVRATFDDVAGIDEVETELRQVVSFLKEPERYTKLGAKLPKGVLLEGAPGTGKTLIARATAGEAGVPFFSASASEFIEMIVGVGASRVRELFAEARKIAPIIIFIDEIDTIGRSRSSSKARGSNSEQEQTLNQILTEMDGFTGTEGIVVIAATNRSDVLDSALTRAGRFDRKITVSAPDLQGRAQILGVHTRNKPLADDVDLTAVAKSAPGMTGADLANLANEVALSVAERSDSKITARDFAISLEKVQLGSEREVVMPEEEKLRTAYHEAGHALLGMLHPGPGPQDLDHPTWSRTRCYPFDPGIRQVRLRRRLPEGPHHGHPRWYGGGTGGIGCHDNRCGIRSPDLHEHRSSDGWSLGHVTQCWTGPGLTRQKAMLASRVPPRNSSLSSMKKFAGSCRSAWRKP